jgi:starch-binding outer membrane protein, SusD/RagB family
LRRDWNIPPYTLSKIGTTDSTSILPIVLPVVNAVFKPASSHWDMDCGKWKREYETYLPKSRDWSPTNFPVIRYADVLLMAAEAENEMGNPDDALVYLNQVRARALAEAVPSTDQVSLRQIIRDERARELCFEGLRKFDLIRWGVFFKSILTCRNSINNSSSSSSLKARYLTAYNNAGLRDTLLPIPSSELNVNGLMTQNAGW